MTILDRIMNDTKELVQKRKRECELERLMDRPLIGEERRSFLNALSQPGLSIIAELKKASPSKGLIREDFDIPSMAESYELGGARALSVLTEPNYFQGSLDYLEAARSIVSLPLLRKDFICDSYQITEAKAYGADAILLIAAAIDPYLLVDLHHEAKEMGLHCLVEIYDEAELKDLDLSIMDIVGVNNRDLRTFEVDKSHSIRVLSTLESRIITVSESGIESADDLRLLREHDIDAALIGETFMRQENPGAHLQQLLVDSNSSDDSK